MTRQPTSYEFVRESLERRIPGSKIKAEEHSRGMQSPQGSRRSKRSSQRLDFTNPPTDTAPERECH